MNTRPHGVRGRRCQRFSWAEKAHRQRMRRPELGTGGCAEAVCVLGVEVVWEGTSVHGPYETSCPKVTGSR